MSNHYPANHNLSRKNRRARMAALVSSLPGVLSGGAVAGVSAAAFEAAQAKPAAAEIEKAPWTIESLQAQIQKELQGQTGQLLKLHASGNRKLKHFVDHTYKDNEGHNQEDMYMFSVPTGKSIRQKVQGKFKTELTYDIYQAFFVSNQGRQRKLLGLEMTFGGFLTVGQMAFLNAVADGARYHSVILPNDYNVDNYQLISRQIHDPSGDPYKETTEDHSYVLNLKTGAQRVVHHNATPTQPENATTVPASLDEYYKAFESFISDSQSYIDKYS